VSQILDILNEMAHKVGIQFMNKKLEWDLLLGDILSPESMLGLGKSQMQGGRSKRL